MLLIIWNNFSEYTTIVDQWNEMKLTSIQEYSQLILRFRILQNFDLRIEMNFGKLKL